MIAMYIEFNTNSNAVLFIRQPLSREPDQNHSQGSQSCYLAFALSRHNRAWERRAIVLVECNLGCWLAAHTDIELRPLGRQRVLPSSNLFQSPRISFGALFNKLVDSAAIAFIT